MDPHAPPLKSLDPEPIDSPSPNKAYPISTAQPSSSIPALPLRPAPDQQLHDRSVSKDDIPRTRSIPRSADFPQAGDFPPKPNDYSKANDYPKATDFHPRPYEYPTQRPLQQLQSPMQQLQSPYNPMVPQLDMKDVKASCQRNIKHLMYLQGQRRGYDYASQVDLEWQISSQTGILIGEVRTLQNEVRRMVKNAKNHQWRRWLFGGFLATFIPIVRKLFRRGSDHESLASSNNTEYAFRKSKGLLQRIKDSVLGHHHLASIAFFVFSVMYVFQNEVTLRVAKTVQKRLKKLSQRLEYSNQEVDEKDLKVLEGWRWRVLLW
ncbi:hypothetical protein GGI43DRAFT_427008 [Trichoderma evansii]